MSNFRDFPKSVQELRSDRSGEASDWTPRDLLINMLRKIDAGEVEPNSMVLLYSVQDDEGILSVGYSAATPNVVHTLGLLARGQTLISQDASAGD